MAKKLKNIDLDNSDIEPKEISIGKINLLYKDVQVSEPIVNLFKSLGFPQKKKTHQNVFLIPQVKFNDFLNLIHIRFTSKPFLKTFPRLYPNIAIITPFSRGIYLFETKNSFIKYDSIKQQYIGMSSKLNRADFIRKMRSKKIDNNYFYKTIQYEKIIVYDIRNLSFFSEFNPNGGTFFQRFINSPSLFAHTEYDKIVLFEKEKNRLIPSKELGSLDPYICLTEDEFSLVTVNNIFYYFDDDTSSYLLVDFNKNISVDIPIKNKYALCNSAFNENGRLLKTSLPVFFQFKQYLHYEKNSPDYGILALNKRKTEFYIIGTEKLIIFNKLKILYIFPFEHRKAKGFKVGKHKYVFVPEENNGINNELVYVYNAKINSLERLCNEKVQRGIFYYKDKVCYIVISLYTIKIVDYETGMTLRLISALNQGGLKRVIFCPGNKLLSIDYYSTISVWDIETGTIIFSETVYDDRGMGIFYCQELYLTDKNVAVIKINHNIYKKRTLLLDLNNLNKGLFGPNDYAVDTLQKTVYFWSTEKSEIKFFYQLFPPDKTKYYSLQVQVPKKTYIRNALEFDDNLLIISATKFFIVYDKKEHKILHQKPYLGGINKRVYNYFPYNYYYVIDRMFPISKDTVLIREIETYRRSQGLVYLYNARKDEVIYRVQPSKTNCFCDIFYQLSNGNVLLRFDLHYLEVWDFKLIQCNTKIYAFEVSYVQEIDYKSVALISKGGIQIINLKF